MHTGRGQLEVGHFRAVAEVGPGVRRLLGQKCIEPTALGHEDERLVRAPLEARAEVESEFDDGRPVLDDRVDREGEQPDRAHRQAAAARLVPREASTVREEHGRTLAREPVRGGRAGRPCTDHEDVKALH